MQSQPQPQTQTINHNHTQALVTGHTERQPSLSMHPCRNQLGGKIEFCFKKREISSHLQGVEAPCPLPLPALLDRTGQACLAGLFPSRDFNQQSPCAPGCILDSAA